MPNAMKKKKKAHSPSQPGLQSVSLWWSLISCSATAHFHFLTVH